MRGWVLGGVALDILLDFAFHQRTEDLQGGSSRHGLSSLARFRVDTDSTPLSTDRPRKSL